jgi:hypothetical protein
LEIVHFVGGGSEHAHRNLMTCQLQDLSSNP